MKFVGENILEFTDRFPDDHSCLAYLSEQKWADGFKCKKCGHSKFTIRK
ncbi:MAG: transposase, partial [Chlorobi bacterium]|nr:transposase [Chlorobiota bacterium]